MSDARDATGYPWNQKATAELVKLRYFADLTIDEAATALHISSATAGRYWTYARAWLQQEVTAQE